MMSNILKLIDILASSYWFIPSLMAFGAFLSAAYMTQSDWILSQNVEQSLSWIRPMQADGARAVMATIAGSMITVAGVTFSITISSIAHATTQFGPRLLTNFMHDRGNQITLGTFIATFLYCTLVMTSISGGSGGSSATAEAAFVPQLAILLGVVYALASTMVLIYFIHHVPASIHASFVISSIGKQLLEQTTRLYVCDTENNDTADAGQVAIELPRDSEKIHYIAAEFTGYIQFLDKETMLAVAQELDTVLVLNAKPGDFISEGDHLGWACIDSDFEEAQSERVSKSFLYDDRRTPAQDILFLANELIEIAARALSPGTNDPYTAMMCLDWLSSSYASIAGREPCDSHTYDTDGALRIITPALSSDDFILETLRRLTPYAATDRNSALHMQATIARLMMNICHSGMLPALLGQVQSLTLYAEQHLVDADISMLQARQAALSELSSDSAANLRLSMQHPWLVGGI